LKAWLTALASSLVHRRGAVTRPRMFIFIVTYARSGSTLLQKIIADIPGSHIMGENGDVLAGLHAAYRSAALTREEQGRERRERSGDPWRGAHRIRPNRFNRRMIELFVDEVLLPPADAWLIGFKEVRYFDHDDLVAYLDYIRASFPSCLLVFNRRDGAAVAHSGWWQDHPADIVAEVAKFDARVDGYLVQHPEAGLVVRYEDYCGDPAHLSPLFARLGVPLDVERLRSLMAERLTH